jgi:DNA polymerase-3 subunit epsilon
MKKYAVVDVETTGGAARFERITEIAVVVHDGKQVLETFASLINPERPIPANITRLTGITNEMVAEAPKFFEVARTIVELTQDAVFVAHNVNFDYGFVREEFSRLGFAFSRRQLCTVRLARMVFPGLSSYSLSNLKSHFGIQSERSHRALDDTIATVKLFEHILAAREAKDNIRHLVNQGIRETKLPPAITLERLHGLPEQCGVYYLHDKNGFVLYVGKSLNIRKRIFEHFSDNSPKAEKLRTGVVDISFEPTGSELAALLLESAEIKRLQPRVNRTQRLSIYPAGIFHYTDSRGYQCLTIGKTTRHNLKALKLVSTYPKLENAKGHLLSLVRQHNLCYRLTHLDASESACFHYSIEMCQGACIGEESSEQYNLRVQEALWTLDKTLTGSFAIVEAGRTSGEQTLIFVEKGEYRGYCFVEMENVPDLTPEWIMQELPVPAANPEATRIIARYLDARRSVKIIACGN